MGIFSKIKENFSHGGVKADLQAPLSVSMNDASLPVVVTVTNTAAQPQNVKKVSVEILATSRNRAFSMPTNPDSPTDTTPTINTVALAEDVQPFSLAPGESKSVQLNIIMNVGKAAGQQSPEGSTLSQIAGFVQQLQSVTEALNPNSFTYSLKAHADVDGIALDPSKSQAIQVSRPGGGLGVNL